MKFRKNPVEFEAVQFTGDNFDELREFCGKHRTDELDIDTNTHPEIEIFNPIGQHVHWLYDELEHPPTGELWVEANQAWLPIEIGEWVIKDELGFYPCKDEVMQKNNTPIDAECTCPPEEKPTFEQDLVHLLNYHSMERYSGTPDWILAGYLVGVLRQFDCAVKIRANWRGESTEMPALQRLFDTNDIAVLEEPRLRPGQEQKTVPLVHYTNGHRNVLGEAVITVTPDEVGFSADMFDEAAGIILPAIPKGQFSIADTDPLNKGDR